MNFLKRLCWSLVWLGLFNLSLSGQTNQLLGEPSRPFQLIVETISTNTLGQQYDYVLRLSHGLMEKDYAAITGQLNLPHFGHLAEELIRQRQFDLMRELLKRREVASYNYYTVAELLAKSLDEATFAILVTNSSLSMPDPVGDSGYSSGTDRIAGEGIPDYSALSLRNYLNSNIYGRKAKNHLIRILEHHSRTGVRAFAAKALGDASGVEVENALTNATSDRGRVPTDQGGLNTVAEYAQQALQRIKSKSKRVAH